MAIWSRLFSGIFGVGVGIAAADAVQPVIEVARQEAWAGNANRVLAPGQLAELLAQGLVGAGVAVDHAKRSGFDADKLEALAQLALEAPPPADVRTMRRRGLIEPELLHHAYAKAQIEPQYWDSLDELLNEHLSPEVLALAIVRGLIPDPGILPVGPPSAVGSVPAFPVFDIDAVKEAKSEGFSLERLSVLTGLAGRPMGPESAAAAVFRDIIERVDYDRAIAEGDVRNEWAEAIFETARQIPSVADYVNARLRGWITPAEMNAGVARHGMSPEDANLLYLRTGRPAAPGQMATAAARGIDGPDGTPMDRKQFLKGIAESDIRPEWGPMLWESRYLYPPLFQLSRLVAAGAIDADTAAEWARKDRYPPEVVEALHAFWSQPAAATSSKWVDRARTSLFSRMHSEILTQSLTADEAAAGFEAIGVPEDQRGPVLTMWATEALLYTRHLTPSQLKRLYVKGLRTQGETLDDLEALGYDRADAEDFLQA